jgi:peptide/nickel transport system substrate-binding protein
MRPNADLSVGPGLAESWEETSSTSWRFRLREGVKFSNGRALTSDDVAGTWKAHEKTNVLKGTFPDIETMTAVDERTFDVTLSAPVPDLPHRLESFWVLPGKDWVAGSFDLTSNCWAPARTSQASTPKGCRGPSTPTRTTGRRAGRAGKPRRKRVEVKFIADDASRLATVRTGDVDFAITANPDVRRILTADPNIEVTVQNTPDLYYLQLNPLWKGSKLLAMAKACERLNDLAYFVPLVTKPTVILHRSDRVSPVYIPTEPNQMTFRGWPSSPRPDDGPMTAR